MTHSQEREELRNQIARKLNDLISDSMKDWEPLPIGETADNIMQLIDKYTKTIETRARIDELMHIKNKDAGTTWVDYDASVELDINDRIAQLTTQKEGRAKAGLVDETMQG